MNSSVFRSVQIFCVLQVCARTRSVCAGLLGVEFGFEWSSGLQFGFGELGQVGHHRLFVHTGVNDFLWSDHLQSHKQFTPDTKQINPTVPRSQNLALSVKAAFPKHSSSVNRKAESQSEFVSTTTHLTLISPVLFSS